MIEPKLRLFQDQWSELWGKELILIGEKPDNL